MIGTFVITNYLYDKMSKTDSNKKYIFVVPKTFLKTPSKGDVEEKLFTTITLQNPRTREHEMFLLKKSAETKTTLCEVNCHLSEPSSWFIGDNYIQSDGSIYISSPVDPLFFLLPYLSNEKSGKFVLLDQILDDTALRVFDDSNILDKQQIMNIAESQDAGSFCAYKYSQGRTLEWLEKKVKRLSEAIRKCGMNFGHNDEHQQHKEEVHYAFGMISDYIDPSLAGLLKTKMSIVDRVEKRKSAGIKQPSAKKSKAEATEDYSLPLHQIQEPTKKNLTRAQKALKKVDKAGMKSISSFFKAKPAKAK